MIKIIETNPKGATIKYFDVNEHRLICTFYTFDNTLQMKTAYICG